MKKVLGVLLLAALLLLILVVCGRNKQPDFQLSQFDLGVRYLSDGNYQEAIAAFQAAIQIDPKQKDAYLGLADAYIAIGDTERAIDILFRALDELGDDPEIIAKLTALGVIFEDNATTPDGRVRVEMEDGYYALIREDENGNILDQEIYNPQGVLERYIVTEVDENGTMRVNTEYAPDGTLFSVSYYRADSSHEKTIQYDEGGYLINETSEDGQHGKHSYYTSDDVLQYYVIISYDENGNYISSVSYHPDGSVMSETGEVYFD